MNENESGGFRKPNVDEQEILEEATLILLSSEEEIARCNELIIKHHYLRDARLVGEHLRYALVYKGQWLAVATWSSAAFHLKDRDQFIGWNPEQCRRRLPLLANNSRLMILPEWHIPNLVSRFMKLMLNRLSQDWQLRWQHPIALVESFVDKRYHEGTAYKASGWTHLGQTAGWKRDADDFYIKTDFPKQIWVRELTRDACTKLRAETIAEEWREVEAARPPHCTAKTQHIRSLMEIIQSELKDFRRAQALAYPLAGIVCLIVMATAQGVVRGAADLAKYAASLTDAQRHALKFRRQRNSKRTRCPGKTVFTRVLPRIDADPLERILLIWQKQVLGPCDDKLVIVDGKKLRHAGVEIVNAVDGKGHFLGSEITDSKTNEIPTARDLLRKQDLTDKLVVADALHTCEETARQILFEGGGDYLLTVKGNQPKLQQRLEARFSKPSFPP